jgi:DNA mismatch repair protein MutS
MSIVQDYLDLTKKYQTEYGSKTIVLMEVGSFFEVYALIKPSGTYMSTTTNGVGANAVGANAVGANGVGANGPIQYIGSHIEDFARINEMVIAKKSNVMVSGLQVVMAGMGTAHADKYIQKLQAHDYTIVIYKQDSLNKTSRNLSEIISPGTYFPLETEALTNNITCVWLYKSKATKSLPTQVTVGLANIDIYTGKTALFQFQTAYNHSPATYDELERYISAYKPSECLFVFNLPASLTDDVIGFVGLEHTKLHKINLEHLNTENRLEACVKNAEKQIYQIEVLKKFFPQLMNFHDMFPTHSIAIQSFCFLLDFVDQHSPNLAKKLTEPVFENYTDRLLLANHSLSQLNIIDDTRHTGKFRSVSSLLNNCVTTMGKRQFLYQLHYPITHHATLQASYDMTEHLLRQGEEPFLRIRAHLSAITDLEKFSRKVVTRKLLPKNFTALFEDLTHLENLYNEFQSDKILMAYLKKEQPGANIATACQTIAADLKRVFNLEVCRNLSDIDDTHLLNENCMINPGISVTLDELLKNGKNGMDKLIAIEVYLSSLIQQTEKKKAQYVKIHETAKGHNTLVCTSRRTAILKEALKKQNKTLVTLTYIPLASQIPETFELDLGQLEYNVNGSSKTEMLITSWQIRDLTHGNEEVKNQLLREMNIVFQNYMTAFSQYETELTQLIKYTTEMDLLQCKAYTAHKYNYCKPTLAPLNTAKSFFEFTGIRHPLIEHLQTNELYVTNDLTLGKAATAADNKASANGILLYGTNAVGKTSFIKSIGIALIMAQAGLYVPCHTFTYFPYRTIFTRILGNDNMFKGLSTFAVEMTELRTILNLADAYSLVLGDELCSGTESDSALSIFTAGLEILHARASTFLFATHFHEITHYSEITALPEIKMFHMAVHYNKEENLLVYDRKLREGSGESMYGLEVCKSLNLPDAFLQRAHDIRLKYRPEKANVLSLSATHFNAKKLVGNCELCQKQKASEVHHLQHQKNASPGKNDYIVNPINGQNFHKNHVANLLNICEACHQTIHKTKSEHKVVKTSEGYRLSKL